ncbi:MAG: DUF1963 domain-containing protein [Anaerobiospirillum sp.]|nr:DUF1963 domain-containing protein [Anaerobiospirillum sp.]
MTPKKTPVLKPLRCKNTLAQLARPCIVLDTVTEKLPFEGKQLSERSFVGGNPLLPADFVWPTAPFKPRGSDQVIEVPMVFYLQIDLADVAQFDLEHLLPDHGILAYFVLGMCTDFQNGPLQCAVRYFEDTSSLKEQLRPDPPEVDSENLTQGRLILPHLPLAAHASWSFVQAAEMLPPGAYEPILGNVEDFAYELDDEDGIDIFSDEYTERNSLLGFASYIFFTDAQQVNDVLLLEIGGLKDQEGKMIYPTSYGPDSISTIFIDQEDLKARRFERARITDQEV